MECEISNEGLVDLKEPACGPGRTVQNSLSGASTRATQRLFVPGPGDSGGPFSRASALHRAEVPGPLETGSGTNTPVGATRPAGPAPEPTRPVESAAPSCPDAAVSRRPLLVTPPSWPPPLADPALHGLAGEIVRGIEPYTEADPAALLVQMLTGVGSILGRGAYFAAEADRHYLNLYVAILGLTGRGRKGSSWGQVRRVLRTVDPAWYSQCQESGLSSGEGLVYRVRDATGKEQPSRNDQGNTEYRWVLTDRGVSDKRLIVMEPELGSTMKIIRRPGNTLSGVLRNAWDGGDLRVLNRDRPLRATEPHISIIGHVTREEALRYLDSTEIVNGFGNRFLYVCSRRSKLLPEGGNSAGLDLTGVQERLGAAVQFGREVGELKRDDDARALWHEVYPVLSEGKPGILGAATARAEAQVMRIACLYAVLDRSPLIRIEHLRAALAVWDYSEASARWLFGSELGDPLADDLLGALRQAPAGLTRTELNHHLGRNVPAARITAALDLLAGHGLASETEQPTGGRTARRWYAIAELG